MDILCPTCQEPWEQVHMREDEPYEWGMSGADEDRIIETGKFTAPTDPALIAAKAAGWEFGTLSVYSFTRCPCCPKDEDQQNEYQKARAAAARQNRAILCDILGEDEDAMISEIAE